MQAQAEERAPVGTPDEVERTLALAERRDAAAREVFRLAQGLAGLKRTRGLKTEAMRRHVAARIAWAKHARALCYAAGEVDRAALAAVADRIETLNQAAAAAGAEWTRQIAALEARRQRRKLTAAAQAGARNIRRARDAARRLGARGPFTQAELAVAAAVGSGSITWAVRALEEEGSLRRTGEARRHPDRGGQASPELEWVGE